MGNLEKLLTGGIAIVFMGYLFIANCKCSEDTSCINNDFKISSSSVNANTFSIDVAESAVPYTMYRHPAIVFEAGCGAKEKKAIDVELELAIDSTRLAEPLEALEEELFGDEENE